MHIFPICYGSLQTSHKTHPSEGSEGEEERRGESEALDGWSCWGISSATFIGGRELRCLACLVLSCFVLLVHFKYHPSSYTRLNCCPKPVWNSSLPCCQGQFYPDALPNSGTGKRVKNMTSCCSKQCLCRVGTGRLAAGGVSPVRGWKGWQFGIPQSC